MTLSSEERGRKASLQEVEKMQSESQVLFVGSERGRESKVTFKADFLLLGGPFSEEEASELKEGERRGTQRRKRDTNECHECLQCAFRCARVLFGPSEFALRPLRR